MLRNHIASLLVKRHSKERVTNQSLSVTDITHKEKTENLLRAYYKNEKSEGKSKVKTMPKLKDAIKTELQYYHMSIKHIVKTALDDAIWSFVQDLSQDSIR